MPSSTQVLLVFKASLPNVGPLGLGNHVVLRPLFHVETSAMWSSSPLSVKGEYAQVCGSYLFCLHPSYQCPHGSFFMPLVVENIFC